jgi:penicillin-binding protein 1A
VEYVRILLEPKYGSTALFRQGMAIHTTLDLRMQRAAEETMQRHLAAFDEKNAVQRMDYLLKNEKITQADYDAWKKSTGTAAGVEEPPPPGTEPMPVQGALVAVDPETGGIRALAGGRDFAVSQFNRAVQARLVDDYPLAYINVEKHPELVAEATDYATLLGMVTGYYPPEPEVPEPVDPEAPPPPDPVWKPKNWDDKYLGPVSLRKGLAFSRNLVSVRLIDRVGPRTVREYAQRVGITSPLAPVLSLGLGSSVVTPLELVGAVATFANDGVHMPPFAIERVTDNSGRVLEEAVPQGRVAISPQTNYLITRLMQAVVQEGTGRHARRLGRPAAGKTGTTQEMRDTWFIGFIPDLAAGVWIGYDDFIPLGKGISSAATSVPWWTDFMAEAMKYVPGREFPVPPGIVFAKIDSDTGLLALPSCRHVVLEAFRQSSVPREFCNVDHDALIPEVPETEIVE